MSLRPLVLSNPRILALLVATCTEDLAYGVPVSPWTPDGAPVGPWTWTPEIVGPVLRQVVHLLGPQARWWSNCVVPDQCFDTGAFHSVGFWSVTDHTLDRALIGIGEQATVTFLAFAED